MRRAALSAVLVAVAVVLQLTVINRLPLPGGGSPDVVLLAVVALGLCSGPVPGALTGFCAGLCLDLAPPASQLIGEYALVFCVIGYACGKLRATLGRPAKLSLLALICAAAAAAAGEMLSAGLALALDSSGVSLAAVRQVLPSSVLYDVAISPFVLAAIVTVSRWAGDGRAQGAREAAQPGGSARLQAAAGGAAGGGGTVGLSSGAGLLGGVGWLAGPVSSRAERKAAKRGLRLGEKAVRPGDGWIGGRPPSWRGPVTGIRAAMPRRLSPGRGVAGTAVRRNQGAPRPARPVNLRLAAKRGANGLVTGRRRPAATSLPRIAFAARSGRASGRPGGGGGAGTWSAGQGHPGARRGGANRPAHSPTFRHSPVVGRNPGSGRSTSLGRGPSFGRASSAGRSPSFGRASSAGRSPSFGRASSAGRGPSFGGSGFGRASSWGRPSGSGRGPSFRSSPSFRAGSGHPGGSAAAGRGRPGRGALTPRPVSLRLRAGRRSDGVIGGRGLGGVLPRGRRVFTTSRPAVPRFRGRQLGSGAMSRRSAFRPGGAAGPRRGKVARLGSAHRSVLSLWTRRRRGGRSTVWRIGSSRTGGLR
jgi:rod shape-determining protein MreD